MKILMCATRMTHGGAETHIITLAAALRRRGHTVVVCSSGGELEEALLERRIPHFTLPLDKKDPLSVISSVRRLTSVARALEIDVVHAHGRIPAYICKLASRFSPAFPPVLVTCHGIYPQNSHSYWGDRTVAVSEDVARYLGEAYSIDEKKIDIIPNGVDIPERMVQMSTSLIRMIAVSRLDSDSSRTAVELIELMREFGIDHPHLSLTVVGGGSQYEALSSLADEVNSELGRTAIAMLGRRSDVIDLLCEHDVFIGSGRAALEAMAVGLPVILCGEHGIHGVLTPDEIVSAALDNFTCRRESDDDYGHRLADAIDDMLILPLSIRKKLGRKLSDAVRRDFSSDMVAKRIEASYLKVRREVRGLVSICGYYGAGNSGDEAILSVILSSIPENVHAAVMSFSPHSAEENARRGVRYINRFNIFSVISVLKRSSLLILGGGTLLQDRTSRRSLAYYLFIAALAKRFGAKVALYSNGLEKLRSHSSEKAVGRLLARADHISLRDSASYDYAKKLGAPEKRLMLSADAAMLLEPAELMPECASEIKDEFFVISPKKLYKRLQNNKNREILYELCEAIDVISEQTGLLGVILPMSDEDIPLCREVMTLTATAIAMPRLDADDAAALISRAEFVISMRLHAALIASSVGVPAVCLSNDPKLHGFCRYADQPPTILVDGKPLRSRKIISAVAMAIKHHNDVVARVSARAVRLRRLARYDAERLKKIIY